MCGKVGCSIVGLCKVKHSNLIFRRKEMETEQFVGTVRTSGGTSLEITIPQKLCEFANIKEGDLIKVLIKKLPPKED